MYQNSYFVIFTSVVVGILITFKPLVIARSNYLESAIKVPLAKEQQILKVNQIDFPSAAAAEVKVEKHFLRSDNIFNNVKETIKHEKSITNSYATAESKYQNRVPRAAHEIFLSDPLDCLSQIICGLNTFPPKVPSARTSTSNDFAYLLQNVILRLKRQDKKPTKVNNVNNSISTEKPDEAEKKKPSDKNEQQNDDESEEYYEDDTSTEDDSDGSSTETKKRKRPLSKDQDGDFVHMKDLYPPFGMFGRREGRAKKSKKDRVDYDSQTDKKKKPSKRNGNKLQKKENKQPSKPKTPTPLEKLGMERDIRTKLRSNARCLYGILQHSCPFRYGELMVLTSAVLERQKVISYSSNKILPMVGYLLKSQSLTETLKSTFSALERINNITITKDNNKEPISFSYIYEEIIHGDTGGNGIKIVETKNDAANSHGWEDDEFDEALRNPYLPKNHIPGFTIKKKKEDEDSPEEDVSEDGQDKDANNKGIPAHGGILHPGLNSPFEDDSFPLHVNIDEDENVSDNAQESQEDIPLPPVYGIESLQQVKSKSH